MNGIIGFVRPMSTRNFGLNSKTQTVANPIKQFSTAYAVPREAWGSARLHTVQDVLCELGMKPQMHLVANTFFSLYQTLLKDHTILIFKVIF